MRRKWFFKTAEEMGEKWLPELHFSGNCGDWTEPALVYHLVSKYEDGIEAVYYYEPFPGKAFSIELQFHDREQMLACRKEYAQSFNSAGKITPAAVRTIERYKGMPLNLSQPQTAPSDPGRVEMDSPEATAIFRRKLAVLEAEHARGQYVGAYGPVRIKNPVLNELLYKLLRENASGWIAYNEGRRAEAEKHFHAYRVAHKAIFRSRRWTEEELEAAQCATD